MYNALLSVNAQHLYAPGFNQGRQRDMGRFGPHWHRLKVSFTVARKGDHKRTGTSWAWSEAIAHRQNVFLL